ncbi:putative monovalent cation/H+ antiporter subunit A [bacterium]|nr:putative monovalent cation/H+ antiporter subunit A [bacterium]
MHDNLKQKSNKTGWILSLLPLSLTVYFVSLAFPVSNGEAFRLVYDWVPSLGISLSFYIDGLSLLFAILISGIGALILIYGSGYLTGHHHLGRFYAFILLFMASMLGLVLADNLITLFVFWELTSISSYLLIGFNHEQGQSRAAALQALLVTGAGGLALLAGFLLLGHVGGSFELSQLLSNGESVRSNRLYLPILLLILAGAFTKSAQVPFHFWLPGAMAAPTPVSAYLHSATMVKAGIYLMARMNPVLGGTDSWHYTITVVGAVTMLTGALLALPQTDLKRILAFSTVSALGTLTLLLGLSTSLATKAAMVFLLVHSLYKGALFMIAGSVDYETGTRDIGLLGGLRRVMPITAIVTVVAGLSMAGLPPLLGFISKELLYEAKLQAPTAAPLITGAGVLANILMVALAGIVCIETFFGKSNVTPRSPQEAPFSMSLGPAILAGMGLFIGLFPDTLAKPLLAAAVSAVRAEETVIKLALWHGVNPVFALSAMTILSGIGIFVVRKRLLRIGKPLHQLARIGPENLYRWTINGLMAVATAQTRFLQNGYLRYYLITILSVTSLLVGYKLLRLQGFNIPIDFSNVHFYEAALGILILSAAVTAVIIRSRLGAVAALGVVGYGVALIFIFYGAPDLAITQILVETLMVILFVLVIYHLPRFSKMTSGKARWRDLCLSVAAGGVISALVLKAVDLQFHPTISSYFAENSVPLGHGRNVVNVILVDFRALDTLGEITVLAAAALGVYALLRLRLAKARG